MDYAGLFGRIGAEGGVRRLRLEVSLSAGAHVGGLAGLNDGAVTDCRVEGSVIGAGDNVGGLIGWNNGVVERCHGAALVHGAGTVGGLAGMNSSAGTLSRCQARREVSGTGTLVGGLAGWNTGAVSECFARGDVTSASQIVGGLVGLNQDGGMIADSYARGAVHGTHHVGGLLGRDANASVTRCFSTGAVTGTSNLGGLAGSVFDGSSVDTDNYWDRQTSGRETSAMGTVANTAAMKSKETFVNWDFSLVWALNAGRNDDYPHLYRNPPAQVARPSFSPRGGGIYGSGMALDVTVSCFTPNAWIHYTTDGSEPTDGDPALTDGGAVNVTLPATLKARAYAFGTGLEPSAVQSAVYDGQTANGVHLSWLAARGFALDGSDDFGVPPGKTQDVLTHFIADLDPADPDSVFQILSVQPDATGVGVTFAPSSSDRIYTLEYCDDLADGTWQPVLGQQRLPGSWAGGSLRDYDTGPPTRIYRVTVDLPGMGGEEFFE